MNIVNVGYDSTNYYVLADSKPRLLVDVGWPGTMPKLQAQCKRLGVDLSALQHFLITHYHPDHAGLAQELKRTGCKLILIDLQIPFVPLLRQHMKPQNNYVEIDLKDTIQLSIDDSRDFLVGIGIRGEIIHTPGHSDDSVSLVLDEGAAFTGDLTHPLLLTDDETDPAHQSWAKIRSLGATTIYGGHGPVYKLH
jgi:ribonuclease/clavin/mitogillin